MCGVVQESVVTAELYRSG